MLMDAQTLWLRHIEKRAYRMEVYEHVLAQCEKAILRENERGKFSCIFVIPPFVMGYPPVDCDTALRVIRRALSPRGFTVTGSNGRVCVLWDKEPSGDLVAATVKTNTVTVPTSSAISYGNTDGADSANDDLRARIERFKVICVPPPNKK